MRSGVEDPKRRMSDYIAADAVVTESGRDKPEIKGKHHALW